MKYEKKVYTEEQDKKYLAGLVAAHKKLRELGVCIMIDKKEETK